MPLPPPPPALLDVPRPRPVPVGFLEVCGLRWGVNLDVLDGFDGYAALVPRRADVIRAGKGRPTCWDDAGHAPSSGDGARGGTWELAGTILEVTRYGFRDQRFAAVEAELEAEAVPAVLAALREAFPESRLTDPESGAPLAQPPTGPFVWAGRGTVAGLPMEAVLVHRAWRNELALRVDPSVDLRARFPLDPAAADVFEGAQFGTAVEDLPFSLAISGAPEPASPHAVWPERFVRPGAPTFAGVPVEAANFLVGEGRWLGLEVVYTDPSLTASLQGLLAAKLGPSKGSGEGGFPGQRGHAWRRGTRSVEAVLVPPAQGRHGLLVLRFAAVDVDPTSRWD